MNLFKILIIISVSLSYLYPSSVVIVSSVLIYADGEGDTVFGVVGIKCVVEDGLGSGDGFVVLNCGAVVVVVVLVVVVVVVLVVGGAVMERNLCRVHFGSDVISRLVISAVGDVD